MCISSARLTISITGTIFWDKLDWAARTAALRNLRSAYATRVAGKWGTRLVKPLARLRQRAGDEHPRVRLEAAVAAATTAA